MKYIKKIMFSIVLFSLSLFVSSVQAAETGDLNITLNYDNSYNYRNRKFVDVVIKNENGEEVSNYSFNENEENELVNSQNDIVEISIKNLPYGYTYEIDPKNGLESYGTAYTSEVVSGSLSGTISSTNNVIINKSVVTRDVTFKLDTYGNIDNYIFSYYIDVKNQDNYEAIPKDMTLKYHGSAVGETTYNPDGVYIIQFSTDIKDGDIVLEDVPFIGGVRHIGVKDTIGHEEFFGSMDNDAYTKLSSWFKVDGATSGLFLQQNAAYIIRYAQQFRLSKIASGVGVDYRDYNMKLTAYVPSMEDGKSHSVSGDYPYKVIDLVTGDVLYEGTINFNNGIAYTSIKPNQTMVIGGLYSGGIFNPGVNCIASTEPESLPSICNDFYDGNVEPASLSFLKGTILNVEELDSNEYNIDYYSNESLGGTDSIYVVNQRKFNGSLTLSKQIVGDIPADKEFTFKIYLNRYFNNDSKYDIPTSYDAVLNGENVTLDFENRYLTVKLKGGDSIVINGLPLNADYEVVEEENEYVSTSDNSKGKVSEDTRVQFVNSNEVISAPNTGDNFAKYIVLCCLSLVLSFVVYKVSKKYNI